MKGIPNRQKKVMTPKRDFKKDTKKFQQSKKQVQSKKSIDGEIPGTMPSSVIGLTDDNNFGSKLYFA